MSGAFLALTAIMVLAANCLWYYIKYVVSKEGYTTRLFWFHWDDVGNLRHLITQEDDPKKKTKYQALLWAFYSLLFLAIASTVVFLAFLFWTGVIAP